MPTSLDDFLRQSRGDQAMADQGYGQEVIDAGKVPIESVESLKGTVFDNSDPIAQWRRLNGPPPTPKGLGYKIADAVGAGAGKVTEALNYPLLGKPLDYLKEKSLDWASQPESFDAGGNPELARIMPSPTALRNVKAYPGAVAEAVKPLASPLGAASFIAGPLGMVARGTLGAQQVAEGAPEIVRGAREGDWRRAGTGALNTALGALLLHEPVSRLAGETAPTPGRGPLPTVTDMGNVPRGALGPAEQRLLTEGQPAAPGAPPSGGPIDADYEDLTKLLTGGTGRNVDFYGNPTGEITRTVEAGQRPPRGALPAQAGDTSFGMPGRPSYTPENSNRALSPDEFLARARMAPGDPLAELEATLGPSPASDPYTQDPLAGFDVAFGAKPSTLEPRGRRLSERAPTGVGPAPGAEGQAASEAIDPIEALLNARYGEGPVPGNGLYPSGAPAGELPGSAPGELAPPDAGRLPESGGNGAGPAGRGLAGPNADLVFERRPPADNAARLTPEVLAELKHMKEELATFPFVKRGFNEIPVGRGGDLEVTAGSAGTPLFDDILAEAPLNPSSKGQGGIASRVRGTRGGVESAIQRVLDTGDIHNNQAEGAVRLAEKWLQADARGERAGGWLPRGPNQLPANMPDELSNLIDEYAGQPDKMAELENLIGGSGHPESPDYVGKVLAKAGPGQPGLAIEPVGGTAVPDLNAQHVVYRGPDGSPVAVAKVVQDMNGKLMVQDLAADKSKGLLTGRAMKAIGEQLQTMGATEAAGTVSPDAQNFMARMKGRNELADVLDTGEAQPRLPQAGAVRDQHVQTPQLEAPFSLAAPPNQGVDALDQALNFNEPKPTATYGYYWPDVGEHQYQVHGGPYDRSHVGASRLRELGIDVPETPAPPPETAAKPVPGNVRDFLVRQLKYTPDDVAAMGFDEAIRVGRAKIPNPEAAAPAGPAPIATLPEGGPLPKPAEQQVMRQRQANQRTQAIQRTAVPLSEPGAVAGAPPPRSPAERQAAGEALTVKEREALNLPPEQRPRQATSLREQGVSPRQIAQRTQRLDQWMADPSPENFARWVQEVSGQAERVNAKQLKGGTGEQMPPTSPSGETLYSGLDPGLLLDKRFQQHIRDFFVSDSIGNLWARRLVGAGVGAALDPDNRMQGALAGFLAATYGPRIAKLLASDVATTFDKGWGWWQQEHGPLPQAYDRTPRSADIGVIDRGFGSKAHTIPDEFAAVRPGVEAFQTAKETGKVDSRLPLLNERMTGAAAAKKGAPRQAAFLKPEITYLRRQADQAGVDGRPRLKSYLHAYADELAGAMTRSEQLLSDMGIRKNIGGRAASEVGNQIYRSGLAFNAGSAAVNRISQPLLATPYVGFKNLWKAYWPKASEKGLSDIHRPVDISDIDKPALRVLDKFDNFASTMMRYTDNQNRQGVYAAAHKTAIETGASNAAAHIFARDVSEKTQGLLGLLSGNPSWRGPLIKTVKPFTKFPILVAEWANDVATASDPRIRWKAAATFGLAYAFSKATGIDIFDMLASGARYSGSTILKAAMDVYGHATNQVKDHELIAAPGSGFSDSDAGNIVYPVGVRKAVDTAQRFRQFGLDTHKKRTPGGALEEVTPLEDLGNLLGIKSTRQNERQTMLDQAHAGETRAATEDAQASAQAKRDFYRALDANDHEAVAAALAKMGPNTRVSVMKGANRDRYERLLHTMPKSRRPGLQDKYGELEKELSLAP